MRNLIYVIITAIFFLSAASDGIAQTIINGKVLSADGSAIVKAEISTAVPGVQDIFAENQIRVEVAEDGAYQLHIDRPGIYNLKVSGVFHHTMNIPVMVYDQPTLEMNILMLPVYFNDGRHFENEDYLQWIRVLGSFNNYDYRSGEPFSLNRDGSISAMVPVTSDTMRIQVSGLSYGQRASAIPPADKYELLSNNSFVSVLYSNLPSDSLEIHYVPNETIPYRGVVPNDRNPNSLMVRGFLTFKNELDRYWVEPLISLSAFSIKYNVLDYSYSEGIPLQDQMSFQNSEVSSYFDMDWNSSIENIIDALKHSSLHEQQANLLLLAYAGVVRRSISRSDHLKRIRGDENIPDVEYDPLIIDRIFDEIEPGHTAWTRGWQLPIFLLEIFQFDERRLSYFTDLVHNHNSDILAERVSEAIVEGTAQNYTSVDQMPVYQAILQRFGEGSVLRRAELMFEQQNEGE